MESRLGYHTEVNDYVVWFDNEGNVLFFQVFAYWKFLWLLLCKDIQGKDIRKQQTAFFSFALNWDVVSPQVCGSPQKVGQNCNQGDFSSWSEGERSVHIDLNVQGVKFCSLSRGSPLMLWSTALFFFSWTWLLCCSYTPDTECAEQAAHSAATWQKQHSWANAATGSVQVVFFLCCRRYLCVCLNVCSYVCTHINSSPGINSLLHFCGWNWRC